MRGAEGYRPFHGLFCSIFLRFEKWLSSIPSSKSRYIGIAKANKLNRSDPGVAAAAMKTIAKTAYFLDLRRASIETKPVLLRKKIAIGV